MSLQIICQNCMSSECALLRQYLLELLKYCSFSTVVLQYQYQGFSIVLQYKTARLVHPWSQGGILRDVRDISPEMA